MKIMINIKFILMLTSVMIAIGLSSCQEASINPYIPGPPEKHPTIADFPNSVGSWWEYEVVDSLNSLHENLRVDIVSEIQLPNGHKAALWEYSDGRQIVLQEYVSLEDDTVKIYNYFDGIDSNEYFTIKNLIVFPIKVGNSWIASTVEMNNEIFYGDSTWVSRKLNVSVPAGIFNGSYEIMTGYRGPIGPFEAIVFYPGVGLVRKEYNYFKGGNNIYYSLINYHIE